jgi:NAD(P)-dependent dehydrogenase (short-subunit alcohol dehydrogenase family)
VLDSKRCLVTGAGGGIGRASAVEMGRQGAEGVVVSDLDGERAAETAELVRAQGAAAWALPTDLRDPAAIAALVAGAVDLLGGLDVLQNNAGVHESAFTDKRAVDVLPEEIWQLVYEVNLRSVFLATQRAAPHLRRSERGPAIVNAASVSSMVASPLGAAYAASKGGVLQLTKATAIDLAPVRCNCYCPSGIETAMSREYVDAADDPEAARRQLLAPNLIARHGQPEEVAKLVCFLASDDAAFITGAAYLIDGGALAWRGLRE